jgi:hypothetical protein
LDDVHDTAPKPLPAAPVWLGVGWILQDLPFHASANVTSPELLSLLPTTVHALEEKQDTPDRMSEVAPAGLGVGWILHALPFHASTSVNALPTRER